MNNFLAPNQKSIDLVEFEEVIIPRGELIFLADTDLSEIREGVSSFVTISQEVGGDSLRFKAGSKVGVISIKGLRIQIRPRLSVREFCTLLRYVLSGQIPPLHFRATSELTWADGFEDAICTLLSDEVGEILRVGLSRRYERSEEPTHVLRGRLVWEKNFPWGVGKKKDYVCRYHELTYDNLDNRLLRAGLRKAVALAYRRSGRTQVLQYLNLFMKCGTSLNNSVTF